jgi:hypothetical protein
MAGTLKGVCARSEFAGGKRQTTAEAVIAPIHRVLEREEIM